jgi:hypothetical protein
MVFDFVKQVGNHLQKDLTKFGYRLIRTLQKFRMNLLCFGDILEVNMAISILFSKKSFVRFVLPTFFTK